MQFDWTTFALEGLNFLVLMWILTRFLYRPVLAVMDARRKAVAGQLEEARQVRAKAEAARSQYEARLADWQTERTQARQALEGELAGLRAARLEALKGDLAAEREKTRQRDAAAAATREQALARTAQEQAWRQVSQLLHRLACAALTARIAALVEEDLAGWDEARKSALRDAASALGAAQPIAVTSAHTLDESARAHVARALQQVLGRAPQLQWELDSALVAGLRIAAGACLLQASLADELAFFAEQAPHA